MIRFFKMLEDVFAAAAFAECGDHETARAMLKKRAKPAARQVQRPRPRISA